MKIVVFVTQFYQLSGAEKLAIDFAKSARSVGCDVTILCLYSSEHPLLVAAAPNIEQRTNCKIRYLGLPVSPGFKDIVVGVGRLRTLLMNQCIDIIEASMLGPSTISALATLGLRTRCLIGIHAVFDPEQHRGLRYTLLKQSLKLNSRARIYCVSNAVHSAWTRFSKAKRNPSKTIYNAISDEFIDLDVDAHAENTPLEPALQLPPQTKIILFVGSLVKNKGIDVAIKAVAPHLRYGDCHFVVVGETGKIEQFNAGDTTFYQNFFADAKPLEAAGVLHFLGHRSDVAALMRTSTVLLHPARSEGFGLVIAEALASGLPVVASRVGGIPEVVGDSSAAIMCAPHDADAFSSGLKAYLSMCETERKKIQRAAYLQGQKFTQKVRTELLMSFAQEHI